MNILLIIFSILIFISIIGILVDVIIRYDLTKNNGVLIIKVFKIPIVNVNLKIEGSFLSFSKKQNKKPVKVEINNENIEFFNRFKKNIAHRLYFNDFDIDCFVILNNPSYAVLLSSILKDLLCLIRFNLVKFQADMPVKVNVLTGFNKSSLKIDFNTSLAISFIDLFWAIMKTMFEKKGKYGKKYRKFNY